MKAQEVVEQVKKALLPVFARTLVLAVRVLAERGLALVARALVFAMRASVPEMRVLVPMGRASSGSLVV